MAGLPVSPVNAWSYASRHNPHDSGPKRIAISISYRTFIDYLLPVYPGASQTPASTGGDLTGVPARACRAAIAKTMSRPMNDVTVFAVKESAAGSQVEAKVTGAEAPWRCTTDGSGRVGKVMYTGSEGRL
jgi:hypothetical protein